MKKLWATLWGEPLVEDYEQSAHFWFQTAKTAAALTVLFFICAGISVLAQVDADKSLKLAQSFAPFFIGSMAAVTFCGAVWRGKINSEQSRQQRRQNDAKEEENLGKLLIDGTKLLGEQEESHVVAGIAALQAVASSPTKTFSTSAMDILVDIIEKNYAVEENSNIYLAARRGVLAGANAGNKSTRSITFDMEKVGSRSIPKIKGVRKITAINGEISRFSYEFLVERKFFGLENVRVIRAVIGPEAKYTQGCTYYRCDIRAFSLGFITRNEFLQCDFSGAVYTSSLAISRRYREKFEKLKANGNYFHVEDPIQSQVEVDWMELLLVELEEKEEDGDLEISASFDGD